MTPTLPRFGVSGHAGAVHLRSGGSLCPLPVLGPGEDPDTAVGASEVDHRAAVGVEGDGVRSRLCGGEVEFLPGGDVEEAEHAAGVAVVVLDLDAHSCRW